MPTIFSKIVKGEIPCHKIAETDDFLAFLDIRPLTKGHTLIIPKEEVDYLFDLKDETYIGLHVFAREVARALKAAIPCQRIATAVIGLEVPHAHIHLIPIQTMDDCNFNNKRLKFTTEEMTKVVGDVRQYLS